jgi:hypothetical protein
VVDVTEEFAQMLEETAPLTELEQKEDHRFHKTKKKKVKLSSLRTEKDVFIDKKLSSYLVNVEMKSN